MQIGMYEINWINEDELEIIKNYGDNHYHKAIICGGDMETILENVFITTKIIKYITPIDEITISQSV